MRRLRIILPLIFIFACGDSSDEKEVTVDKNQPWIGKWQMVGYDAVRVENRDTLIFMTLSDDHTFHYETVTKSGEVLMDNEATFEINDQHSIISILENGKVATEYFIRKVDKDSLLFNSDTLIIRWKRIN